MKKPKVMSNVRCVHCHNLIENGKMFVYSRSRQSAHINCVSFPDVERMDHELCEKYGEPYVEIEHDVKHLKYIESLPSLVRCSVS